MKSDVSIAKNYLQENEIRRLERAVTGYFDYIEDLIERENAFNMEQFAVVIMERRGKMCLIVYLFQKESVT